MKISTAITNCKKTAFAFLAVLFCLMMKSEIGLGQTSQAFTTIGSQSYSVPTGVTSITIAMWGAGGAGSLYTGTGNAGSGGSGAYVRGTLAVTSGQTLAIMVGGGGLYGSTSATLGGGGAAGGPNGGSGGGYSGVFNVSITQANALVIAGGGAGGGYYNATTYGGAGGATSGSNGGNVTSKYTGGGGGTMSTGGGGGLLNNVLNGSNGSALTGGSGGINSSYGGGGGGGGYFGGGGGYGSNTTAYSSGGGGGASYLGSLTSLTNTVGITNTTAAANQAPGNTDTYYATGIGNGGSGNVSATASAGGNGRVVILYYYLSTANASDVCAGSAATINLTASTANLPVGTYTVTYNLTGNNTATGNTATMTVGTAGSGSFNTSALATAGATTVTITSLKLSSGLAIAATGSNAAILTVKANNTAGAPSSTPTVCINTAIPSVTINTTGATGISTATGLPAGVNASFASNTITISGTPTASGTFNYTIPLTGGCGTVNATGTINVTAANTVTAGTTTILCINTAIFPTITHTTTGATGIGAATELPAGVSASFASNKITISGTPTASGSFNYSIPLTGGCGNVNATGTINVTAANTVTAGTTTTLCINTAISPAITHTTTGATGIGTATGLPAGVSASFASNKITISGTPTVSGLFSYTIPLTGGCGTVNATGTINVTAVNTVTAGTTTTLCINTAISPAITHTTTGATGIGAATGLPTGVSASFASNIITISGTPTASGTFNYTILLTGGCGTVNATGTINVTAANTVTAGTTTTLCINTAISPAITHTTTGATGIGTATGLPAGVTALFASNTITISGTPTASGTFNYTILLTGGCGTVNATGTITVTPNNTAGAPSSNPTLCINTAISPVITIATTGATGIGTATGLPAGVTASFASNTITVSGTPTASGTFNYTIPLTGGCGTVNATGTITVNITAAPTGTSPQVFCADANPTVADLTATGNAIQWYAAATGGSPLPGTTALADGTHYYATQTDGTTGCESLTRLDVLVTVNQPPVITTQPSPAAQILCATANVSYSVTATGTDLTYQWYLGSNPVVNGGRISGATTSTLTIAGLTAADGGNYTVVVSGTAPCSPVTSAIAHLDVNQSIVFSAQPLTPQTICEGSAYTIFAQATGATGVGSTFEWRHNGTFYATGTFDGVDKYTLTIPAVTPADAGQYRLYLDDGSGTTCSKANSNIATLVINPTPTATISGDATVCQNSTAPLITFTNPMALPVTITYNINGGTNTTVNVAANNTATVAAPTVANGSFVYNIVSVSYQSAPNCDNSITGTATITVNPTPSVTAKTTTTCSGTGFSVTPVDGSGGDVVPTGTTYSWAVPTVTGGLTGGAAGSGAGSITGTLTNPTSAPQTATYTVTPTAGTCSGIVFTVTVTINPTPVLNSSLTPPAICNNTVFSYNPMSATTGVTFNWSRAVVAGISNAAATGTNNPNEILINTTTAPVSVVYVYTLSANGCSNTQNVTITVNPTPTLSSTLTPPARCSNVAGTYTATSATTGTTFTWTRAAVTGISNAAGSGSGAAITETLINTTANPVSVVYAITLTASSCTNTQNVTVVINPTPTLSSTLTPPAICNNTVFSYTPTSATTGTTFSWSRAVVTGISNAAATGTDNPNETLINTTANPVSVMYVYTLTANGCTNTQNVTVSVKPTPTLSSTLTPPARCSNVSTTYTATSATSGTTYTWTRAAVTGITPATGSGGGASGLITETLVNSTANPITVTYVIVLTANGCSNTQSVNVTVNPSPTLSSSLTPPAICNNTAFNYTPTSATTGVTYNWSRAAVAGISNAAASGTNNPNETLINTTANPISVTYAYTLSANSCSNTQNVVVVVNPTPTLSSSLTQSRCNNTSATYTATSTTSGTTYSWTRAAVTGISNAAGSGSGAAITETLINTTTDPVNVVYVITLTANTCTNTQNVTVTVNPTPTLSSTLTPAARCSGTGGSYTATSVTAGVTYSWSRAAVTGISNAAASGSGATITETLVNTTNSAVNVVYAITLTINGCGNTQNVTVTVNPKPSVANQTTQICSVGTFTITPTNGSGNIVPTGTTYSWSAPTVTGGLTGGASGTNASNISGTLINPTNNAQTATYTVTPVSGSCTGSTFTVTVTVAGTVNYGTVASGNEAQCTPANPSNITLSTAPSGGNGNFTYQWYYQDGLVTCPTGTSTTGWTSINGATGSSYNPPNGLTNSRTYAVVVTPAACGVATWASNCRQVTVNPLPAITPAASTAPRCFSASAQTTTLTYTNPTNNPTTYSINYNNAANNEGFVDVTNATLPASPITINIPAGADPDTYTGTITVKNANGCTSDGVSFTIIINPLPVPTLTNSPASPVCANTTVTYTTDAGQSNYIWTFSGVAGTDYSIVSGGNSTSNTAAVTWKTSTPATKTVTVNYVNANGCTAVTPTSKNITVLALPTGSVTVTENSGAAANDNKICAGDAVNFTATSGYGSYTWKVNGTTVQGPNTDNTYSTTTLASGQTVTVDVANANNCGSTFTAPIVTVNPLPSNPGLTISPSTPTCPGTNVTFTASPTGTGYSYNFKLNGSSVQSGASTTYSSTTFANGDQVTVDVTNNNGCTASSSPITINVSTLPSGVLTVSPGSSFCIGTSVTFTATSGFSNYNFKINGTTAPGGNSASNTYTTTALTNGQVVSVDVTNSAGCTKTFNPISVTVNPLPTGTLTATENSGVQNDNTICAGSPVTFTFSASSYSNYNFKLNGVSKQSGSSNSYVNSTLIAGDAVTVVVTSGSGCTATFSGPVITVIQPPTGSLTPSATPICAGNNETFTATAGYTNYNFQVNGTTVQNGSSNTYSTSTLAPGDAVTVDVTGSNGCVSTFTATVTVNPTPTGTLAIAENSGTANDGIICTGTSVTFTAPNGFTNYNFLLNGASIQNGASKIYTTTTLANGDKVNVAVTGIGGCIGLLNEYTITVNPLPTVAPITTTAPSFDVCVGSNITLQDATNTGGTFTWNSENPGFASVNASTGVVTGVAAGNAVIDYTFTNSNGCSTTVTAMVIVHALPTVQPITGNFNICTGTNSQLNDATTGGSITWISSNTGVATVDGTGLVHGAAQGSAVISYSVTDVYGCTTTVTATVTVSDFPSVAKITTTSTYGFNVCTGNTIQLNDATSGGTWSEVDSTGTGTINSGGVLTGTTAGIVIIYYSISSSCGLPAFDSVHVNVNTPPSANISYSGGPFCTTAGSVSVTQTGTTGGTYSSTSGLTINASNGIITPSSSTGGIYTVIYTIPASATGGCGIYTTTTSITITTAPTITSLSYVGTPYCSTVTSASPTLTSSSTTGTYSFTVVSGGPTLSLNTTSGIINPSTSSAGTYNVTYTIAAAGGCALVSKTTSVTITAAPAATITYTGTPFCSNAAAVNVSRTGTAGGTYSSTTGLTINTSTGAITPSSSTPGTYTVTYTIAASAGCSVYTTTTTVAITAAPTVAAGAAVTTCSNSGAVNITAGSSASNYTTIVWSSSGTGTFANQGSLTTTTYTPSAADISAGSVTLTLKANGNGNCAAATSTKTLTITPPPPAFIITPSGTVNVCQGSVQPLTATSTAPTSGSVTVSSGNINVTIPDDIDLGIFGNYPQSITRNLAVTVPAGAIIDSMKVNFNITHTYDNDLVLNLKAPNGNVLNLVNREGANGDNFTNTTISSTGTTIFTNVASAAPFTGVYTPDGYPGVGTPISNIDGFFNLFSTPSGNWTFGAEDDASGDQGKLVNWSISIYYTVPGTSLPVTWSPNTDLYIDAGATTAYTGTTLSTVYAKPSTAGTKTYTATATNAANCSTAQNVILNVGTSPAVTITADYCAVAGKVKLTANSTPAAISYLWSTGETTQSILVDLAGIFSVTAYSSGSSCPGKATINVANELLKNGNFEAGDINFTSSYPSKTGVAGGLNNPPGYAVDTAANYYGPSFLWGKDHTTGHGKFMMVNGTGANYKIWQQTVSVLPNTTYYFSAWGLELDNLPNQPFTGTPPANATLQFNINGTQVGTLGNLPRPNNPQRDADNNQWVRFYGTWTSGSSTTSAVVSITDLQSAVYGNNFGLDDISFSTLSTFVNLISATGTDAQTVCVNNPIQNIVYSAGSSGSAPTVSSLPAGITSSWNGVYLTISGTPNVPGNYSYTITTTGSCQPATATGTITVQAQKIALSSGSASPSVCANAAMPNIVFTLSGTATNANTTGLPTGVTGTVSGSGPTYTYTISGTPTAAAGSYPYTITTSGTCTPVTFNATITITSQTITLNSANNTQTVCINAPIANIQYTIGGTGTNASATGLPPGVTGSYNSGLFVISGSPTNAAGSPYNYTVTTSGGSCAQTTATGTITVTPAASFTLTSGAATNPQTVCKGSAITNITFSVSNATGASATGLPAGVTGAYSGGVFTISGTPTAAAGTYNYTITSSGGCAVGTTTGSITVQAQTISLTSGTASPSVCANTAISNIVYTIGGTATGASITGLPTGVTGTLSGSTFTISGTPTAASGPYPYTITTSGTCGAVTANGTITISPAAVGGTIASVSICSGSSGILTLTGQTGSITRWEVSTDFGTTWTYISNTTISQNFNNVTTTTMYRALISGCGNIYSSVATVGVHNLWTGRTSTDWNVTSNWSDNSLPSSSCTTVMIPAGTPNQPQLTSNVTVPNLMIASTPNTTVDLNGNTLTINGSFTGSATGNIKGSAMSGLVIGGNASTLYFDQTVPLSTNILKTFTINTGGNAVLGNALNIAAGNGPGTVTANGTLTSNGNLTLKSDYNGTASVGISAGSISGDVTVERFIPPLRAWRFLTTPTNTAQNMFNSWMEGQGPNSSIYTHVNGKPGYGTEITYDNNIANGFDVNTTTNPSIKYWDSSSSVNDWIPPVSTYIPLRSHDAWCIFVRGSRAVDLSLAVSAPADQTILRTIGSLNETNGNPVTRAITGVAPGGGFFVGNPYASSIDIGDLINSTRITGVTSKKFSVWDPKRSGSGTLNVGGYVDYDDGVISPNGSPSYSTPASTRIIESGQAFFLPLNSASTSASVQFKETDKSATQAMVFGKQLPEQTPPSIYTNLMVPAANGLFLADGVAAGFGKDYSDNVDDRDAQKRANFDENMMLERYNNNLSIEMRPIPILTDTLFYRMYLRQQQYVLKIFAKNMSDNISGQAWLVDKYLNTKTAVNLNDTTLYSFRPNSDLASYRDRFMLVFKRTFKATPVVTTMSSGGATAAMLNGTVSIYPNPVVTGGKILLKFDNMKEGKYEITISSLDGKALTKKSMQHKGGNDNYEVQLDARWATGNYLIKITSTNGFTITDKLLIGK